MVFWPRQGHGNKKKIKAKSPARPVFWRATPQYFFKKQKALFN
jgi:hypothetical protein